MNEPTTLTLALAAGLLLGAIFFGGLWWTIRRAVSSRRPGAWFVGSLLTRMAVCVGGFFLVARGDWRRLLACLLGFLIARILVVRLTRKPAKRGSRPSWGGGP